MGYGHIWDNLEFRGTYGVYAVGGDGIQPMVCRATIDDTGPRNIQETRAYRRELKRMGKKVRSLRDDTLHDELVVVFGPKMSPGSAVKRLRELANHVEKNGMLIGVDMRDNYVFETVDGSFLVVDANAGDSPRENAIG
jgi:hypothetical protein